MACEAAATEFCDWLGQHDEWHATLGSYRHLLQFIADSSVPSDLQRMTKATLEWLARAAQGAMPAALDAHLRHVLVNAMNYIRANGTSADVGSICALVEQELRERGADPDLLPSYAALLTARASDVEMSHERMGLIEHLVSQYCSRFPEVDHERVALARALRRLGRLDLAWCLLEERDGDKEGDDVEPKCC